MAELLSCNVLNFVKKQMERLNIKNCTISVLNDVQSGRNVISRILRVKVEEDFGNGNKHEFILKTAVEDTNHRDMFYCSVLFEREIYIYTHVLPEFTNIQQTILSPFDSYPKFYGANAECDYEALLLQNMTQIGFSNITNANEPLDYNHTMLIMRKYGELHALSYILRDFKPELFQKLKKNLVEHFFTSTQIKEVRKVYLINANKALLALDPVTEKEAFVKFKNCIAHIQKRLYQVLRTDLGDRYAVIGHGDCWINNFMFKYDSTRSRVPTNVCFLDWQFSRIGSPALDLSHFLFSSTDKKLRDLYYDIFIEEYHKSLCSFFITLGGKSENCLPYNILEDHLKKFSIYGLYIGLQALFLSLNQPKEKNTNNPNELLNFESTNMPRFRSRAREMITDFIRYGYDLDYEFF